MKKTALLFGGQGSQFIGMGKSVYEYSKKAREVFDISTKVVGRNMADLCFSGPSEILNKTFYSQLSILTVELALYETFKELNVNIGAVAGLSLGEYAALFVAEVISLKETFELVSSRAMAMEKEISEDVGRMIAVIKCDINDLGDICNKIGLGNCGISNYNSNEQVTISVKKEYYNILTREIRNLNGLIIPLKINRPFHHKLMKPAADVYLQTLSKFSFEKPSKALYLNVTGELYNDNTPFADILYRQVYEPVLWNNIIDSMLIEGITEFYEISPKSIFYSFIKNTANSDIKVIDVNKLFETKRAEKG